MFCEFLILLNGVDLHLGAWLKTYVPLGYKEYPSSYRKVSAFQEF